MAIKSVELVSGCMAKAADDEPVFVLRAQDVLAPRLVRLWADLLETHTGITPKTAEAYRLAAEMEKWPGRKMPD